MVKASVFYPREAGKRFDWDYYRNRHIPAARKAFGSSLAAITVGRGLAGLETDSPAPFLAICELDFDSLQAFQRAMATGVGPMMNDLPNFTDIRPSLQISEVVITAVGSTMGTTMQERGEKGRPTAFSRPWGPAFAGGRRSLLLSVAPST